MRIKTERMNEKEIAMQTRCIYCRKEQYSPAVYPISMGESGCCWCGKIPPKLTVKQYQELLSAEMKKIPDSQYIGSDSKPEAYQS